MCRRFRYDPLLQRSLYNCRPSAKYLSLYFIILARNQKDCVEKRVRVDTHVDIIDAITIYLLNFPILWAKNILYL